METTRNDITNKGLLLCLRLLELEHSDPTNIFASGYRLALKDMFGEDDFRYLYSRAQQKLKESNDPPKQKEVVVPFPTENKPL